MIIRSTEQYTTKINLEGREKNGQAIYRYMLLEGEKEIECYGRTIKLPCFGIEIIRENENGDNTYAVVRNSIECMTTYKYKVVQLLKKLCDNCVSPIHLIDIAGEYADEWTADFDSQLNDIAVQ